MAPAGFARPGPVLSCALVALACLLVTPRDSRASGEKGEFGLGVHFGGGHYDNGDFNADLERIGYGRIESGIEYGFSGDYRLSRWVSLTFSATRIGGDSPPPGAATDSSGAPSYSVKASALIIGVAAHALRSRHANLALFAGIGPLLNATAAASPGGESMRTGACWQGGASAEYRFSPMVSFVLTGLARHARARGVQKIAGDASATWDLTFNGVAVWFGPRLYFGTSD